MEVKKKKKKTEGTGEENMQFNRNDPREKRPEERNVRGKLYQKSGRRKRGNDRKKKRKGILKKKKE